MKNKLQSKKNKVPMSRNIKLSWINYAKLRMLKSKFEMKDFDSVVGFLLSFWRKTA